jgi:hypothetical protein
LLAFAEQQPQLKNHLNCPIHKPPTGNKTRKIKPKPNSNRHERTFGQMMGAFAVTTLSTVSAFAQTSGTTITNGAVSMNQALK